MAPTGIARGLNKGFITKKVDKKPRPSACRSQGKTHPRVKLVREVVREVAGFAVYEKRIIELLRIGSAATQKRALKFAKKKLGTHKRGKNKREEMQEALMAQRRKQAGH